MYSILGPAWAQLGSSMSGYMCPFSVMLVVAELMGTPYPSTLAVHRASQRSSHWPDASVFSTLKRRKFLSSSKGRESSVLPTPQPWMPREAGLPSNQVFTEGPFVQTLPQALYVQTKSSLDLNTDVHLKMKNQIKRNQPLKVNAL